MIRYDIEINSIRYWAFDIYIEKYRKKYQKISKEASKETNFSIFTLKNLKEISKKIGFFGCFYIEKLVSFDVFRYLYQKYPIFVNIKKYRACTGLRYLYRKILYRNSIRYGIDIFRYKHRRYFNPISYRIENLFSISKKSISHLFTTGLGDGL